VLGSVTGIDRRGRREGAIVEVLERGTKRIVGRYSERDGVAYVAPDDRRIHLEVMVPPGQGGNARNNQIVVVQITEPPSRHRPPFGRVLEVLGDRLTPSLAIEVAVHGHGLPYQWPDEVIEQANETPLVVGEPDHGDRIDIRHLPLVTIDGEDAKDFDDAVYCETDGRGFRLIVAIADVSHYVTPDSALDVEARTRATSVYFPGFVVPMLPEVLSNGICSLKPEVDRMCFVCDMRVDFDGEVTKSTFYRAVMRSHARLTYTQVWNAIGEKHGPTRAVLGDRLAEVERLHQLYRLLYKQRQKRGAIEFETSEVRFVLGPGGEVVQAGMIQRNDAHMLIEECMITANVEAANFLLRHKIPAPYRAHEPPPASKLESLEQFLRGLGIKVPWRGRPEPRHFEQIVQQVKGRDEQRLVMAVLLRAQSLASYQAVNTGHFGLALEAYAHFTSPIRRYPDLLVHRAVHHVLERRGAQGYALEHEQMEKLSEQCSHRSRRAEEAERDVNDRLKAIFMERHIGDAFKGQVTGVTSFGLFVELANNNVSGLVHITSLPNDYYHFDPVVHRLTGERGGKVFQLAQKVTVRVMGVNIDDRKIDFELVT
jgi:ribonuclease R